MKQAPALRTPDERFVSLHDFPHQPRYIDDLPGFEGLRMARVELGDAGARETFLCLHGEPTWSYLYRKMADEFVARGHRVVMPDLFGFGRSDKPIDDALYGFDFHRESLVQLVTQLDLERVTLVVQDWGGLLGLTLPMSMPERIERLLVMNTTLACGEGVPSSGFASWRDYMAEQQDPDVGALMRRAVHGISDQEVLAYDAPFPDARFKAGVRRFPAIVPTEPDMSGAALSSEARQWLEDEWRGPVFFAVGVRDPVLGLPVMEALRDRICHGAPIMRVEEGGHFVQEHGAPIARAACDAFGL